MALTLNGAWGFETGGFDEFSATSGSPAVNTGGNGVGAYQMRPGQSGSATYTALVSDAGAGRCFGIWVKFSTAASNNAFCEVGDSTIYAFRLQLQSTLVLGHGGTGQSDTGHSLTSYENTWIFVEVYVGAFGSSAPCDVHINGSSIWTGNIDTGTATNMTQAKLGYGGATNTVDYAAGYLTSGAASASDLYGNGFQVKGYKSNVSSTSDNGSTMPNGELWADTGLMPLSSYLTQNIHTASYTANNANGSSDTDTSTPNTGPSGDTDVGSGASIKGAIWLFHAWRTTGSNSTPFLRYGNVANGVTDTGDILTTSDVVYQFISETTNVPAYNGYFRMGMGKNSGGRDVYVGAMMGMLVFVQPTNPKGTLSQTVGSVTNSGAATVLTEGTATPTLGAATVAGTATVLTDASATPTLGDATLTGVGQTTFPILGTLASTLADVTISGVGVAFVAGSSTPTLDAITNAGVGTVLVVGTAVPTLADTTLTGLAAVLTIGTSSTTLEDVTLSGVGTAPAAGSATPTLADITLSGVGVSIVAGAATPTLADITNAGVGAVLVVGSATPTLDDVTLSGVATVPTVASATPTLDDVTLSGTGLVAGSIAHGELNATTADTTLSGTGTLLTDGTASISLADATVTGNGTVLTAGGATVTMGDATLSGIGGVLEQATLSFTVADIGLTGSGKGLAAGTLSATLDPITLSGVGASFITADLVPALGNATLLGLATVLVDASSTPTLADVTLSGTGATTFTSTGTLSLALADAVLAGVATVLTVASATPTMGDTTLNGFGQTTFPTGTLSVNLGALTLLGLGTTAWDGQLDRTLGDVTLVGIGKVSGVGEPARGSVWRRRGLLDPPRRTGDAERDTYAMFQWLNYVHDQIETNTNVVGVFTALQDMSSFKDAAGRGDIPSMVEELLKDRTNLQYEMEVLRRAIEELSKRI